MRKEDTTSTQGMGDLRAARRLILWLGLILKLLTMAAALWMMCGHQRQPKRRRGRRTR